MYLSIPTASLWYFQLVLSLSNDIPENPGPQYNNNTGGVLFFVLHLNPISKDEFSGVSLLNEHNCKDEFSGVSLLNESYK